MKLKYICHRITLLVIALFVCTNGFAQTIDARLKQLEQIKSTYGEMDERYLSALSEVAGKAIGENNIGVAIQLRQQHTELIKRKYGKSSIQYAEGLVRNAACILLSETNEGENTSPSAFQQLERSIKLFEQNNVEYNELYLLALYEVANYYAKNNKYDRAFLYLNKNIELYRDKCRNTKDTSIAVSYFESLLIHTIWSGSVGDCHRRIVYSLEADSILTRWNIQRYLYPSYILGLFKGLSVCYQENDDIASRKVADEKYGKYAKMLLGGMSEEYIFNLRVLANDYFRLNQFSEAISTQKNYIRRVRALEKKKKISEMDDSLYFQSLFDQALICRIAVQQYDSASYWQTYYEVSNTIRRICETNGDILSENYIESIRAILKYYRRNNNTEEFDSTLKDYESIIKQTYRGHDDVYDDAYFFNYFLNDPILPTYNEHLDRKNNFIQQGYSESQLLIERQLGEIICLAKSGRYDRVGNILKKIDKILKAQPLKCEKFDDSLSLMALIHRYDGLYRISIRDTYAEKILMQAMSEFKRVGDTTTAMSIWVDLGKYYYDVKDDYINSLEADLIYADYLHKLGDTTSESYFITCNNIGLGKIKSGDLFGGISILERASIGAKENIGEYSHIYASLLESMAVYFSSIDNHSMALTYAERSSDILQKLYGDTSDFYAEIKYLIGEYAWGNNMADYAIDNILTSVNIYKHLYGDLAIQLLPPYGVLIRLLAEKKDFDRANIIKQSADKIWEEHNLDGTLVGVDYITQIGDILFFQGNKNAYDIYANYIHTVDSLGLGNTEKIYYCYPKYLVSLLHKGEDISEKVELEYLLKLTKYNFWSKVVYLNTIERERLLTSKTFDAYKDIIFSIHNTDSTNSILYDYLLFSKGLLLSTTQNYIKAVIGSNDSLLAKSYFQSQRILDKEKTNIDPVQQSFESQLRERQLLSQVMNSKLNSPIVLDYTFDSIITYLKGNEVSVEYVAYVDYNKLVKDIYERRYAVLLLRKGMEQPIYIPLCTADEIEPLVNGNPNLMYNGGEISQSILNLLWKPIEKYLHKGDEVYFSPDGCLYKLALENIQVAENVTLGTKYNMHRCSSTRQIRDRHTEGKYHNAVLYGGLSYDVDEETMRNNSRSYEPSMTRGYTPAFGDTEANVRRGWNYLPGTKQEIDDVSTILRKKKIVCNTYSGADGNEESFKAMSGSNISILHIATHGFYIQEAKADKVKLLAQTPQWMLNTSMIDKALRRSGLMLAGGNKAWKTGHGIKGIEDGVLTAQEISNMNLSNVDLLVLSACETGLGDVANEGVFGLQWAFKSAGVGTIIMSLWDVDDNATALMMKTFYRELTAGKDKREAFALAQKEVKKIYKDPLQWAAFIMLD